MSTPHRSPTSRPVAQGRPGPAATSPPTAPDAQRIAEAVRACPAVAGLHSGPMAAITTTLPLGPLVGVTVSNSLVVVGVVGRIPFNAGEIVAQVREAIARLSSELQVTVSLEEPSAPARRDLQGRGA